MTDQRIYLAIWKPSDRAKWLILEHERLLIPNGDLWLVGDLSIYVPPPMLPQETGLHLCDVTATLYQQPGFGTNCRIHLHRAERITCGMDEMLAGVKGNR